MKKIWINKTNSFKEAEQFDENYYLSMSREQRVEIVQFLREQYLKIRSGQSESRKGLRRFIKVIK
ncbi:MAG: hypothetical protein E3J87_02375 [Candidatus Cloacimonadota bacterium]|nr:MAG: hypothetical protein E3J87_02375 [Candidatus Cloacimonadota bacterium]